MCTVQLERFNDTFYVFYMTKIFKLFFVIFLLIYIFKPDFDTSFET